MQSRITLDTQLTMTHTMITKRQERVYRRHVYTRQFSTMMPLKTAQTMSLKNCNTYLERTLNAQIYEIRNPSNESLKVFKRQITYNIDCDCDLKFALETFAVSCVRLIINVNFQVVL